MAEAGRRVRAQRQGRVGSKESGGEGQRREFALLSSFTQMRPALYRRSSVSHHCCVCLSLYAQVDQVGGGRYTHGRQLSAQPDERSAV